MLFEYARAEPGQTVMILGAAGNVGAYVVQLAANAKLHVVALVGSKDIEYARNLGAETGVDYQVGKFDDAVRSVDIVIDTVGGDTRDGSLGMLKPGGILVSVVSTGAMRSGVYVRESEDSNNGVTGMSRDPHLCPRVLSGRFRKLIPVTVGARAIRPPGHANCNRRGRAFQEADAMYRGRSCVFQSCLLLLAGCSGLCACYSGLASLHDRGLVFSKINGDLIIFIEYLPKVTYVGDEEKEEGCVTLHGFRGSLNGTQLEVVTAGRYLPPSESLCEFPQLKLPAARFPTGSAAHILISDDSMEIKADLPELFGPRTLSVASQSPGQIRPGEAVVISWTPESDHRSDDQALTLTCEYVRSDVNLQVFRAILPGGLELIDAQHVRLQVPTSILRVEDLPVTGRLSLGPFDLAVDRCDGAKCFATASHSTEIALVPP